MKHGSLFSGIGGFDIAAEWMGWENIFHCEWNKFGQKVLKYYWPKAISYENIIETDFTIHRGQIDILTGGFPCQPYSQAGKRLGKEDDRHLWPEMLRAIQEIKPIYIVGENVSGIISWNEGMVFNEVQTDLENEGYEVQPVILPAVSVNAPHRRDRVWFVAYSSSARRARRECNETVRCGGHCNRTESKILHPDKEGYSKVKRATSNTKRSSSKGELQQRQRQRELRGCDCKNDATDTMCKGLQGRQKTNKRKEYDSEGGRKGVIIRTVSENINRQCRIDFQNFPTQSPICTGNDGLSARLDGITFPKWRNESIKAGGNAIVPQVALQIFKVIQEHYGIQNKKLL